MQGEIRLHGHIDDTIEYFATAASNVGFRGCFYETEPDRLRFFSPGNEFILDREGIGHRGNGGSFCEYMFGVDQPLPDLAKPDVRNRLVLYGAKYQQDGSLVFSDSTDGRQSYERIFFDGNAVCNFFFFLTGSVSGSAKIQQEEILRLLGKLLKRSSAVGEGDDTLLSEELLDLIGHKSTCYLFKLVHKKHRAYHQAFRDLYFTHRSIPDAEFAKLQRLAERYGLDQYQQERIRIDVMYKHPDNRRIVDEYKNILISCQRHGTISKAENARLTRLKTLSVRNKIPSSLFYALDDTLKYEQVVVTEEKDYLAETREILAGIFLQEHKIDPNITPEDMIRLLYNKKQASENRDHSFEQILLETGKVCDEKIRDGAPLALLESFSYIITYFDRYDNVSSQINQLAFMENIRITEEMLRSLIGNLRAFESLDQGLFDSLFYSGILENKYLGRFGRRKIALLKRGLSDIDEGSRTIQNLISELKELNREETLYRLILTHLKEHIRKFYSRYTTQAEQDELRLELTGELQNKGLLEGDLPTSLFREVVTNIKKEAVYINHLLPQIITERNLELREDFLENSGLDRFYLEELERQYFEHQGLPAEDLLLIRTELSE